MSLLPPRLADFARGLHAYLGGQADSAVHWLGLALAGSPQWTEAHMALGEVYYHLLPAFPGPPDSLARAAFAMATADTGFTPPRFHLAELAIRRVTPGGAEREVHGFLERVPVGGVQGELLHMLACVGEGRRGVEWDSIAATAPLEALRAAKILAAGGAFPGCGEDGFRAVFEGKSTSLGYRWGAFLGLQGVLASEGRISELRATVDSAVATGLDVAPQLYLLDHLAGVQVSEEAAAEAGRLDASDLGEASPSTLWLLGAWHAERGDRGATRSTHAALAARAASSGDRWVGRYAEALETRLALWRGDTAAAIAGLRAVFGSVRRESLEWNLGEPLPPERLLLARLLLATGRPADAIAAAGVFDHQEPAAFLPFVPASLLLRNQAALALGRPGEARRYQERLAGLGHTFDASQAGAPSPNPEAP